MIGEVILRRNSGYPDEPQKWIKTVCNKTYLDLMQVCPDDFRREDGSKILINNVSCDICNNQWRAMYYANEPQLECPNCKQMAYHNIVNPS